ncbi:MAG: T9SS type A sorting domain-containing protein, partial [Bacteroidota bacterium]
SEGECVDFAIPLSLVGIGENHQAITFSMYPNPVENELTIGNLQDVKLIEIFSITGKRVNVIENILTSKVTISTSELSGGIYFVAVHGNSVQTSKFIKN